MSHKPQTEAKNERKGAPSSFSSGEDGVSTFVSAAFLQNKMAVPLCPVSPGKTVQSILQGSNMNASSSSMIILAMYAALHQLRPLKVPFELPFVVETKGADGRDSKADIKDVEASTNVQAPMTAALAMQLVNLLGPANAYFVELVTASQVKPLRVRNVSAYFKSCQMDLDGDPFMKHLSYMAAASPKLIGIEETAVRAREEKWLQYHTTYASSPQLCSKAISALQTLDGKICSMFFSQSAIDQVNDAIATPWDKDKVTSISPDTLCKTYWFLMAMNQLPEGWFQGQKARDTLPPFVTERMRAFFVQLSRIAANKSSIEGATKVDELIAAYRNQDSANE